MEYSATLKIKLQTILMFVAVFVLLGAAKTKAQGNELVVCENYKQKVKPHKIRIKDSFSDMKIEFKGDIRVSDDDKMITGMSPGAYLKVYKKTFGNKRGLEIREADGTLRFDYYSGNKKLPFEPEGREWLAEILPDVVRKTGIDAEERANRYYKKGGANAVLSEIGEIPYDNIKMLYYKTLIDKNGLSANDFAKIGASIDNELSYDSSKGELLNETSAKFLKSENSSVAFFNIIKGMAYDSEKNKILDNLDISKLSVSQKSGFLTAVQSMAYDSEKAKALMDYNSSIYQDKKIGAQYFSIVKDMSYDSYRSKVLIDLLKKQKLDPFHFQQVLQSLKSFSYDSEILNVLLIANRQFSSYKGIDDDYFSIYQSMSYDSYQAQGLTDLIDKAKLDDEQIIDLLKVLTHFSYDSYQSKVILQLVPKISLNKQIIDAFFATVKTMSYDSEMEKVILSLVENRNLTDYAVSSVIKSVRLLSYDSSKARVLKSVIKYINNNPELKSEFKMAAKAISSDSEYRSLIDDMD